MPAPIYKVLNLMEMSEDAIQILKLLKSQQIVQSFAQDGYVIIARYTINLSSLKRYLKQYLVCVK